MRNEKDFAVKIEIRAERRESVAKIMNWRFKNDRLMD